MRQTRQPSNQPGVAPIAKSTLWLHWSFTFLFVAALALAIVNVSAALHLNSWLEAVLMLVTATTTITALARQLPLQNILLATVIIALIGGTVSAVGAKTDIPFGPFVFSAETGPRLFKILPWIMPFIWVIVVLNSRGVARLILRPWRKMRSYGFWLIGLTAVLVIAFDLAMDPFAAFIKHYWIWTPTKFPVTWQGAPLSNFLSWGIVTGLTLGFATPALINKQPGKRNQPDFHPLTVWLGLILLFGITSALHGLWLVVGTDAVIAIAVILFAIRGAKW